MSIRIRITMTREYDANPEYYPEGSTPEQMAKLDASEDPFAIMDHPDTKVSWEVVNDGEQA